MADTVFNIFGNHLSEAGPRRFLGINNLGENANVGKLGLAAKALTPSRINKNISTPKNTDLKNRTFLQNEGTSIQSFYPKNDPKKKFQSTIKNTLQVYEDNLTSIVSDKDERCEIEYTNKPLYYDDASDDEFSLSERQLDDIVLGLPKNNFVRPPLEKIEMELPHKLDSRLEDILVDDFPDMDEPMFESDDMLIPC